MSSNSVCNHTVCYHSYDYRPNWTPLSPGIIGAISNGNDKVVLMICENGAK